MTQNTLFVNQMTQNTLLYSIYGTAEQILTYVLPYSAKKQVFLVFGLFCPVRDNFLGFSVKGGKGYPPFSPEVFWQNDFPLRGHREAYRKKIR